MKDLTSDNKKDLYAKISKEKFKQIELGDLVKFKSRTYKINQKEITSDNECAIGASIHIKGDKE